MYIAAKRRARSRYAGRSGAESAMRLKSCRPSPWCIQSDWAEKSFTYMPVAARRARRVVFASEYWRVMPSQAVRYSLRISSSAAERMQLRPAIEILERIVRPVVRAPAQERLEIAARVVVLLVELPARGSVVGKELALEPRPCRRGHRRVDDDGGGRCGNEKQQRDEKASRHGAPPPRPAAGAGRGNGSPGTFLPSSKSDACSPLRKPSKP